jgi:hypothetical protein
MKEGGIGREGGKVGGGLRERKGRRREGKERHRK